MHRIPISVLPHGRAPGRAASSEGHPMSRNRRHARSQTVRRRYWPTFEVLEARLAPALVTWDGGGGNFDWNNRFNWNKAGAVDPDTLPGFADDAQIGAA